MKSLSAPFAFAALFSGLLLAPGGALASKVAHREIDYRSVSDEILNANQQQEQLANLQVQAEILNNMSRLEALNRETSATMQRWCDTAESTEKEREQRLGKLIDSNVPDEERIAAREARAAEVSYDRLVTSACNLQKQEIHFGLQQDLAAIQLKAEGSANPAAAHGEAADDATGRKAATIAGKKEGAAAAADTKNDKEFQAYMASVETGSDSDTDSGKQDAEVDATTEEGEEPSQDEAHAAPAQKPVAVAASASTKKPQASHEKKAQKTLLAQHKPALTGKEKKHKTSFLQLANEQMLSQMSLTQVLALLASHNYTNPKQAKRWCHYFESKGKEKTWAKPLKDAHSSLNFEKDKLEKLKALQLGQKKEVKLRARFDRFWQADARSLEAVLQQVDNSSQVWAANTHGLHAASDRKASEAAQARFKQVTMFLQLALEEREKNIKEQEKHIDRLESALTNADQHLQDQEEAAKKAESKLEKVEAQISHILDVCEEIKREGPKLLLKGITQF
eukprot:TRINITY_DN93918_c0_g1_i1.p1 TRINITY_DN93918_c0_g1~~TRINITY_DN93918_c0_g1_i1.p1  ORF type:complete len:508 (-),score=170.96 TRINITY_DN93918_c0_g1_i1:103-1626(-)